MKDHIYIKNKLIKKFKDIKIEYFKTIGSTNDYLLNDDLNHQYHLCYTDIQTQARGQRGSRWIALNNGNIYCSIAFKCNFSIRQSVIYSIKASVGVLEAMLKYIPENLKSFVNIKLPNDIYFKDQKIAGILKETKNIQKNSFEMVVGIGANVNMLELNEDIDSEWTSLEIINGKELNYAHVLVDIISSFINALSYSNQVTINILSKHNYIMNKQIIFNYGNNILEGLVKNISKNLKLTLLRNDKYYKIDLLNISKIRIIK